MLLFRHVTAWSCYRGKIGKCKMGKLDLQQNCFSWARWINNWSIDRHLKNFLNRALFVELSGLLCLTKNRTLTPKCEVKTVAEYSNEHNGERFKAKFRKKKYSQYMLLNRSYQTQNATEKDKPIKLTIL